MEEGPLGVAAAVARGGPATPQARRSEPAVARRGEEGLQSVADHRVVRRSQKVLDRRGGMVQRGGRTARSEPVTGWHQVEAQEGR